MRGLENVITDSQIKSAIKRIASGKKTRIELRDAGERGAGRLMMILRKLGERVATEWYAVYYRSGKRAMTKLGSYPTLSVADARKKFREEYAPAISAGAEPASAAMRRRHGKEAGSIKELFTAYVDSLKAEGKRSAKMAENILLSENSGAAQAIGSNRPASEVRPEDIVPHLAEIHGRGSPAMAAQARAYLSAAFAFGLKAENDYTHTHAGRTWRLANNPVSAILSDNAASVPGDRFLAPSEFRTFWLWLEEYEIKARLASAVRLMLATGQRAEEILRISETAYERPRSMLCWEKTKNGLPHSIPLPSQALTILDRLNPNACGLFFPHQYDHSRPASYSGPGFVVDRFLEAFPTVAYFVPKDIRRTWKTLAGDAGISKDMRDRLQNHARNSDISSRHYDRYDYLAERRVAMAQWGAYLARVLTGEIKEVGQRESNVVSIGKGEAA
jgi:integrase